MRVLFKYIAKMFFGPFLIGLGGFIVFVSVELLYQLSNIIVRNRVGFEKLLVLIYYHLPSFTADGIPVGVLLAIFWTISALSQRRELMAFQVHGISLKNLFFPFFAISAALSVFVYLLNDFVVPDYYVKAERYMSEAIFKRPRVEKYVVSESVIRYKDKFIYVGRYDKKREVMEDVMVIDYSGKEERVMTAEKVYRKGNSWYLVNGRLYIVDEKGRMRLDSVYKKLKLDFEEDIGILLAYPSERKMSHEELVRALKETTDRKRAAKWIVELHRRYATALAPVIIVLTGLSLSLIFNLTSKSWGVILTFVIVVLYQGSGAWLSAMGREMIIDPRIAVWLPDVLFGGVGLFLFLLVDTSLIQRLREIFSRLLIFAILLISLSGFSYTIQSDVLEIKENEMRFFGNVKIFDGEDLVAEASEAVYNVDGDYLILFDTVSSSEDRYLKSSEYLETEGIGFAKDASGWMKLKDGTVTILSASVIVSSGDVRLMKNADLELSGKEMKSRVKAIFVVSKGKEIERGMGRSQGKASGKDYRVKVAVIKGRRRMEGIMGDMIAKIGKKDRKIYFAGNYMLILEGSVTLQGAYITTCSSVPPHYQIAFEKAFVERDYIAARHTIMFIRGFPVFYFPYFYQFFVSPPPVSMSFRVGAKDIKPPSFSFNGKWGDWSASYGASGNSRSFSLSGKLMDHPVSLSWKGGKTGITIKGLPLGAALSISSAGRSVSYTYSFSKKISKSVIKFLVKRYSSGSSVSWTLPNLSISKLQIPIPFLPIFLKYFNISGGVSYSENSLFEHLDELKWSGKFGGGFSKALIKEIGSKLSVPISGTFKATPTGFEDYSVTLKPSLSIYSKSLKYGWFEIGASQSFAGEVKMKKDEDTKKTLVDSGNYSLSLKTPILDTSVSYTRSVKYEGIEELEETSRVSKLGLSGALKFLFIPLTISGKSAYDFLSEEPKFTPPDLSAVSSFSIGDLSFSFSASTKYYYDEEEKFKSVAFKSVQAYKKKVFKNEVQFTYKFGEEVPIKEIVDKFSGKGFKVLGFSAVSGLLRYNFSEEDSKVTYFYVKLGGKEKKYSHSFSLKYTSRLGEEDFSLSFGYSISTKFDPSFKLSTSFGFEGLDLNSFKTSLSIGKKLHCWSMGIEISGGLSGDSFSFSKIFLSFSINDLPGKGFKYDMMNGEYEFNFM